MDHALVNAFDSAIRNARPPDYAQPPVLYHYTTAGGFEGIIRSRAIRATNFSFMNDPSEIAYGRRLIMRLLGERRRGAAPLIEQLLNGVTIDLAGDLPEIYVASFSTSRDDLSQWRAYGGSPARFALGFPTSFVHEATTRAYEHFVRFSRVLYEESDQIEKVGLPIDAAVAFLQQNEVGPEEAKELRAKLTRRLLRMLPGLKEPAYRAEAEWRIVILARPEVELKLSFDTSRGVIRPYLLFPLETREGFPLVLESLLVLAPAHPDAAMKAAGMVLRSAGITNVNLRPSGIPFAE